MKKTFKVLAIALVLLTFFGVISASAKGTVLSNDIFYAEIPDNFKLTNDFGDDHYYFTDTVNYSGDIEIFVQGNIYLPDGIRYSDTNLIIERIEKFIYSEESSNIEVDVCEKGSINGISACYLSGMLTDSISEEYFHIYVIATKENLVVVKASDSSAEFEKQPEYFKNFISTLLVNGTYYNGEKLSKPHDFSKSEHYIDALERDVLTEDFYNYNSGVDAFAGIVLLLVFALPLLTLIFFVLYIKTKKKLKEYKEFFGSVEQAKAQMQRSYYQNGYGYNRPINQAVNQPQGMPVNPAYQPSSYSQNPVYQSAPQGNPYNSGEAAAQRAFSKPEGVFYGELSDGLREKVTGGNENNLPPELQDQEEKNNL